MLATTVTNAVLYGIVFFATYYILLSLYEGKPIHINVHKLLFYVSLFCLFGISGEILVDTIWTYLFSQPLWLYHLFPTHGGYVSYFFPFVWGGLGYYKYLSDEMTRKFRPKPWLATGLLIGGEAVFIEILYNGLFFLLFGGYIFYYLPDNLWIFSHLSCLQVIPFYFTVGAVTQLFINQQNKAGYDMTSFSRISFYWMAIFAIMFF